MNGRGFGALIVTGLLTANAHAAVQFGRIADTSTAAPGGTGTFTSFDPPSSNREALPFDPIEISFRGVTSTGVKGVYAGFGSTPSIVQISRVVDSTMPMLGFPENYGDFTSVSGGGGGSNVLWTAIGAGGTNMGVFSGLQNGGTVLAKSGDVRGGFTLGTFGPVAFGNYNGAAYQGNVLPGNVPAIFDASGNRIAFGIAPSMAHVGFGSDLVIAYRDATSTAISEYAAPAGGTPFTRSVAALGTPIPGGSGGFTGFGEATATTKYVLFRGTGANQQGIYRSTTAGFLSRVADLTTIAPDGSGAHFTSFTDLSPGDEFSSYDAFIGTLSDGREGLYLAQGSTLSKLIGSGDALDGRTVEHLFISRDAIEQYNVGFKATFTDGSQGIYAVVSPFPVPEPGLGMTILPALIWLGQKRRPRATRAAQRSRGPLEDARHWSLGI